MNVIYDVNLESEVNFNKFNLIKWSELKLLFDARNSEKLIIFMIKELAIVCSLYVLVYIDLIELSEPIHWLRR